MTRQEREKVRMTPGIVKSGIEKVKPSGGNPTMQMASVELPVAEQSILYREYYATTLSTANSMPMNGEFSVEFITSVAPVTKTHTESPYKKLNKVEALDIKPMAVEEILKAPEIKQKLEIPDIVQPKFKQEDTDMEMAMEFINSVEQIEAPMVAEAEEIVDMEENIIENVPVENVFSTLNSVPEIQREHMDKQPRIQRGEFKQTKPFMVVDRVEVRAMQNVVGETIYMIGREACDHNKFEVFKQEVAGKILAMECKHLELNGQTYKRQSDGFYINDNNDIVTIDDLLDILHQ